MTEALATLRRWEDSGAAWRVVAHVHGPPASVTVALLRCDGGEEVDRLTSDDPALLAHVAAHAAAPRDQESGQPRVAP